MSLGPFRHSALGRGRLSRAGGHEVAKVERGKAVSRVWCWGSREGQVSGRREGFLLLGGDQGRDREAPVGFDHVQLVGPVQEQSE